MLRPYIVAVIAIVAIVAVIAIVAVVPIVTIVAVVDNVPITFVHTEVACPHTDAQHSLAR